MILCYLVFSVRAGKVGAETKQDVIVQATTLSRIKYNTIRMCRYGSVILMLHHTYDTIHNV